MGAQVFAYIWEYRVKEAHLDAFEHAYGPHGDWVRFFSQSENYLRTELHKDNADPLRFVTVDYWTSRASCEKFRKQHESDFNKIDTAYEVFTEYEKLIGNFDCFYKE